MLAAGQRVWVHVQNGGQVQGLVLQVYGTHIAWSPDYSNGIYKVPLSYVVQATVVPSILLH